MATKISLDRSAQSAGTCTFIDVANAKAVPEDDEETSQKNTECIQQGSKQTPGIV